jgi:cytochrome c oxidase subunit III
MTTHAATADSHAPAHGHQEAALSRGMAGMVLFIASEIMLFGGLFAAYFYVRTQAGSWPPSDVDTRVGRELGAILTVILISSSIMAHFGILGLKRGNQSAFKIGIFLAIVLGTIFIGGQIYEWFHLFSDGLNAKSGVYGSTFFLITGFHGAHVIVGLCMLWVVFGRSLWNDFTSSRHTLADAAVTYWHFVDVIWVFVFSILYLSY